MKIALATCKKLPEPDPDETLLIDALWNVGIEPELTAWDDERIDYSQFALCVIRSTWNYIERREDFLAWAQKVDGQTWLYNRPSITRFSSHKSYLADLEKRGLPIVPTVWLERGAQTTLASIMEQRGWQDVVVKPQVGAGSYATERFTDKELAAGERFLGQHLLAREMMVQPYLKSVEGRGERALVWIDGELTHAVRKSPRLGSAAESVSDALDIEEDERAFASKALAPFVYDLLYGRVDVARDDAGELVLMELELVEPSLFLLQHAPALERFVSAIQARAQRRR